MLKYCWVLLFHQYFFPKLMSLWNHQVISVPFQIRELLQSSNACPYLFESYKVGSGDGIRLIIIE